MATGYLRRVSANGNGGRIRLTPKAFDKTHRGEGNGYPVNGHLVCILAGVSGTLEDCWDLAGILETESGKAGQMGDPWWLRCRTQPGRCLSVLAPDLCGSGVIRGTL